MKEEIITKLIEKLEEIIEYGNSFGWGEYERGEIHGYHKALQLLGMDILINWDYSGDQSTVSNYVFRKLEVL